MSESHVPFTDPVDVPRTWRRWWQGQPRWLKIAVWTVVGAIVLQGAIAVRICIGLTDTPEVARIRAMGGGVSFHGAFSPSKPTRQQQFRLLVDGFWGRSNRDVVYICVQRTGSDELLKWICQTFPNLEVLIVGESPITTAGLSYISQLSLVYYVDFRATNLNDLAAVPLSQLPALKTLDLSDTLLTNAAIPVLTKNASLTTLEVSGTDVSREAHIQWLASRSDPRLVATFAPKADELSIPGSIRWADGTVSAVFEGRVEVHASYRLAAGEEGSDQLYQGLFFRSLVQGFFLKLANGADGNYRFVLTINGHVSTPVTFQVTDGHPSIQQIEFVMPINEATARLLGTK